MTRLSSCRTLSKAGSAKCCNTRERNSLSSSVVDGIPLRTRDCGIEESFRTLRRQRICTLALRQRLKPDCQDACGSVPVAAGANLLQEFYEGYGEACCAQTVCD